MRITSSTPPSSPDVVETLERGASGEPVKAAQNALLNAGFSLPRYGADGDFGAETAAALARFQKVYSLPASGRFDEATLRALATAKSPSPEYDALFSDGLLKGVVALGFDEAGSQVIEEAELLQGLRDRGYGSVTEAQRQQWDLDPAGRYVTRTQQHDGKPVTVVLELISPETEQAKERFATALRNQELVLYGGHGRYGSGPDFDDIDSPAGNFVIGEPFEPGHVTFGENDLAAAPLTPGYQLMFFDGCNTFRYLDDLRSMKTPGKDTKNLEVVGSTTELYWNVTAKNLLTLLDGVTGEEDIATIEHELDDVNRHGPDDQKRYFVADGFEDNVRP
jgi:hypothetical protein